MVEPVGELTVLALDQSLAQQVKAALARIDAAIYSTLGRTYAPGPWAEENFVFMVPGKWDLSCICYRDWEVIGFWIVGVTMPGLGFVYRVGFDPSVQGKGWGKASFAWVWDRLQEKRAQYGLEALGLEVSADNHGAIRFYKSLGFSAMAGQSLEAYLAKTPRRRFPVVAVEDACFLTSDGQRELAMSMPLI